MSTPSKGNAAEDAANKDPVSEFFTVREQTIIMHSLLAMKELPTVSSVCHQHVVLAMPRPRFLGLSCLILPVFRSGFPAREASDENLALHFLPVPSPSSHMVLSRPDASS